jgi:hypothetical protein
MKDTIEEDSTTWDTITDTFMALATDSIKDNMEDTVTDNLEATVTPFVAVVTSLPEFVWTEVQYNTTASTTTKVEKKKVHGISILPHLQATRTLKAVVTVTCLFFF